MEDKKLACLPSPVWSQQEWITMTNAYLAYYPAWVWYGLDIAAYCYASVAYLLLRGHPYVNFKQGKIYVTPSPLYAHIWPGISSYVQLPLANYQE